MKLVYRIAATLLGTTLLAGTAAARDHDTNNPSPHPHFSVRDGHNDTWRNPQATGQPHNLTSNAGSMQQTNVQGRSWHNPQVTGPQNFTSNAQHTNTHNWNGQRGSHNGTVTWSGTSHRWNNNTLRDHNVARWGTQDRNTWQHGHWEHGRHNGRNGWWWFANGTWFFYNQPIYPYPGYVSDFYYDNYDDGAYPDEGYGDDYAPGPDDQSGYYWYYCNDPAGYYPYVKTCRGPWRAVPPTPPGTQQGYDQNQPPDADENGDQGPPPDYNENDQNGPPPGYTDDNNGPPPGYDNGQDDNGDNGPPPPPHQ